VTLRVSGGVWRGLRLRAPSEVRPTQERVREALFSRWAARLPGATVLDLYAGSGIVGIEAISRGASWCGFVDERGECLRAVEHNLRHCGVPKEAAAVARRRLPEGMARPPDGWPERVDLVFADPPYAFRRHGALLEAIAPRLSAAGEAVVEHSSRVEVAASAGLQVVEDRRYGETSLAFLRPV
jgi:16S rRNA (guanine966-N2)-methyltransferase